jgi:hypothetical protein
MRLNARQVLGLLSVWLMLLPLPSVGQSTASHAPPNTPNTKRIEGTVARVDGNELLLTVKGGTTETYQLAPSAQLLVARPGQMADLTSGKSVGCTSIYSQGDKVLAGECHIYSDSTQGPAKGQVSTDASGTGTIEGTIADVRDNPVAVKGKGRSVLVQITSKEGTTTMTVSSLTKITVVRTGDASALKAGVKVRGISVQAADGTGVIQRLTMVVGKLSRLDH